MFCNYVHSNLCKIHICSNSYGCCDSCFFQYRLDYRDSKFMGGLFVDGEVARYIHKDFVYAVYMNILGGNVSKIYIIYIGRVLDVSCHSRRSDDKVHVLSGMLLIIAQNLLCFEETRSAGDSVCFKGWRYRKADGFICS